MGGKVENDWWGVKEQFSKKIVNDFLDNQQYFSRIDRLRIQETEGLFVSNRPICKDVEEIVTIPAFYLEKNLFKTISLYLNQNDYETEKFALIILVNGPSEIDISSSKAYKDVLNAQNEFPELTIGFSRVVYELDKNGKIIFGRIRKDLSALALLEAANAGIDIRKLILVTNDADVLYIPPKYLLRIDEIFNSDKEGVSKPVALTMDYDHPMEDYKRNHYLFATRRFLDFLEIIERHSDNIFMRGGNSAYRAIDYIEAGGFTDVRVFETVPLTKNLLKLGKKIVYNRDKNLRILTSSRRISYAARSRESLIHPYGSFGSQAENMMYEDDTQATLFISSDSFLESLEGYIQATYENRKKQEGGGKQVKDKIVRAAKLLGVDIVFIDDSLKILNVERLLSYIKENLK